MHLPKLQCCSYDEKKTTPQNREIVPKKMSNPLKTFALALFVFVHFTLFKLLMFAIPLHHNVFCVCGSRAFQVIQ